MANRPRAEHIKQSKATATGTLAKLLLNRSMVSAQDLQDQFQVGEQTESASEFVLGDYWNKAAREAKTFSDDRLARVAHLAVARGLITFEDAWKLALAKGGPRILRSVHDLLIDSKCGVEHSEATVLAHLDEWQRLRKQLRAQQSSERASLEKQLGALRESLALTKALAVDLLAIAAQSSAYQVLSPPCATDAGKDEAEADFWWNTAGHFRTHAEQLVRTCDEQSEILSKSLVEESLVGEVGDLPQLLPRASDAQVAVAEFEAAVIRVLESAWDDDDDDCEIHVAEFADYDAPIAAGEEVLLIWTQWPSTRSSVGGKSDGSTLPTQRHEIATEPDHV
ncbi:MAG: hypothetical protein ABI702_16835 [Burkholderiales bacterium]